MTAPRYRPPNNEEMITIRATAPTEPDAGTTDGISRMIMADAQPASADARTYFQTAAMTEVIIRRAGLPAYQRAGIVRTHKDATHATAIPTGPHGSPSRKSSPV